MMLNGLRKFRVAEREKRPLLQIKSKEAEPQTAEGDRQNNVQPGWDGARSKFRRVIQNKSTRRMKMSHMAIFGRTFALRFTSCDKSRKNGTKKWNTNTITATTPQPPYSRVR